jgi:hypothetical protein
VVRVLDQQAGPAGCPVTESLDPLYEFAAGIVARVWADELRSMAHLVRDAAAAQDAPLPPHHIQWSRNAMLGRALIRGPRSDRVGLADVAPTHDPVDWLELLRQMHDRFARDGGGPR